MSSLRTQRRSWKCYLCGTDIVEGQRFTFTSRGLYTGSASGLRWLRHSTIGYQRTWSSS
ncbi:MAG: DUF2175 family protein [Caldivirga sp.]